MTAARRTVTNVLFNWIGFLVNLALAFVISPIVVRALGSERYGLWVILLQFTGYLGVLELGVRSSVVKYVASYHAEQAEHELNRIVNGALAMYAVVASVSLVISVGIAWLLPHFVDVGSIALSTGRMVVLITGLTVAQGFVFNVFFGVLMGLQRYDVFNRVGVVAAIVRSTATVLALRAGHGLVALAVIQLASNAATNIGAYIYCRRLLPALRLELPKELSRTWSQIWRYSFATFFVTISQKVIFQTDALIIGTSRGPAAVTYFAIPGSLIEYMRRLVIAMTETFVPLASQLKARGDDDGIRALLLRGTRATLIVGVPMAMALITMGETFIYLWMGPEWAVAGRTSLWILAAAQVVSFGHLTAREVLNGMALHRLNAKWYGVEAVANLLLSLALVGPFGIVGVAFGTALPHAIITGVVFPHVICRELQMRRRRFWLEAVVPGLLTTLPFVFGTAWLSSRYPAGSLLVWFGQLAALAPLIPFTAWLVLPDEDRRFMRQGIERLRTRRSAN